MYRLTVHFKASLEEVCLYLSLSQLQSLTYLCIFKGLTDQKLKRFLGNVNYENMIYYILLVFIILMYSMKSCSHQLKL